MADIQSLLKQLSTAVYGKDVRQTIVDAIKQCYNDASTGLIPVITTNRVDNGIEITITVGVKTESFIVEDAYNPVRGTDYWTDEDLAVINETIYLTVIEECVKRGQLKPEFANDISKCKDTTKLYVLPDGYIYAYMETEVEVPVTYTNQIPISKDTDRKTVYNGVGYKRGYRLSGSSGSEATSSNNTNYGISGFIPAKVGDVLRITEFDGSSGVACYVISYDSSNNMVKALQNPAWVIGAKTNGEYAEQVLDEATFGSGFNAIRLCLNGLDGDTIATINEEIKTSTTTITNAWMNTGHAFVPADYEDRIINLEKQTMENTNETKGLKTSLMFISPDGNDDNDGLTKNKPKKTVKSCVDCGATKISAKRGVYSEKLYFENIKELEIFPTDNDQTYSTTEKWHPIIFEQVDDVAPSTLVDYNSIKKVAYSNTSNEQFDKVFVKKSQPCKVEESGYGSRYNSTIWLLSGDEKIVCIKLKPVLTIVECEVEVNTFTYVDGYIYINADLTNVDRIVIPTNWGNCITFKNVGRVVLTEVHAKFGGAYNMDIRNCPSFELYKCACKYTSYASGFHPVNANGVFNNCYATKNYDGFGISGYGHQTFIDCVSEFNFDDGVSHHDGSKGTFIGGRYEGNGKGGNTPAYGAEVNIYGGLYKNNASFGIGYLYTSAHNPANGIINGAVIVNNPIGLQVDANCNVTLISSHLEGNTTERNIKGNLTEYGNTN